MVIINFIVVAAVHYLCYQSYLSANRENFCNCTIFFNLLCIVSAYFLLLLFRSCYHDPNEVEQACRDSLNRLKLDYLDLFLVHTIMDLGQSFTFP